MMNPLLASWLLDFDLYYAMDYRAYDTMMMSSRVPANTLPVATISTGIALTDRFKLQQHSVERKYVPGPGDGYGLPDRYGGQRAAFLPNIAAQHHSSSIHHRQLALALAKSSMTSHNNLRPNRGFRGARLPVQSRLGIPRQGLATAGSIHRKLNPFRGVGVGRGGMKRGMAGRGQGLNQLQKSPAFISRAGTRGGARFRNQSTRGQRGGAVTRSRGGASRGGGRGGGGTRNKNSHETPVSREALDDELDSYMAKSKSYLDRQLDDYMLKAKEAQLAVSAGVAVVDEADVTMTDADATL